mmetsp:Transcript_39029/g.58915  ORF Transcript_39029/g.58915 Transcript_39029/m.58915 type:complete len:267 (-) Transcript_39029:185-985(-)
MRSFKFILPGVSDVIVERGRGTVWAVQSGRTKEQQTHDHAMAMFSGYSCETGLDFARMPHPLMGSLLLVDCWTCISVPIWQSDVVAVFRGALHQSHGGIPDVVKRLGNATRATRWRRCCHLHRLASKPQWPPSPRFKTNPSPDHADGPRLLRCEWLHPMHESHEICRSECVVANDLPWSVLIFRRFLHEPPRGPHPPQFAATWREGIQNSTWRIVRVRFRRQLYRRDSRVVWIRCGQRVRVADSDLCLLHSLQHRPTSDITPPLVS